jgi:tetratricopeptide (TPR) repeat protein
LGFYYTFQGRVHHGIDCLEKALTLATSAKDISEQANILNKLSSAKWQIAEYTAGYALAIESQRLCKLVSNFYLEAQALWLETSFWKVFGNYKHSLRLLQSARESLRLCAMSGAHWDLSILQTEADTYQQKSEYGEALSILGQICEKTSPEQDMFVHSFALLDIGKINTIIGSTSSDVKHYLESAKKLFSSIRYLAGVTYCEMSLASLKLAEGDLLTAKQMFQQCLIWSWGKDTQVSTHCLEEMSDLGHWQITDFNWVSRSAFTYLAFAHKIKQNHNVCNALRCLGDVFLFEGDDGTAECLFTVALEGFTCMDVHRSKADCLLRLGDIMQKRDNLDEANSLWMQARPLFQRSLRVQDVVQVDTRLTAKTQDTENSMFHLAQLNVPTTSFGSSSIQDESKHDSDLKIVGSIAAHN